MIILLLCHRLNSEEVNFGFKIEIVENINLIYNLCTNFNPKNASILWVLNDELNLGKSNLDSPAKINNSSYADVQKYFR